MRLFIAIDLPDFAKKHLQELQDSLSRLAPDAKFSFAHDFHMTLKFLGSCDEKKCERVKQELAQISFEPFEASLSEIGTFGGSRYPRIIWVGIKVPEALSGTARDIEQRMAKYGFEKEDRFKPHITLARVKFVPQSAQMPEAVKKIRVEPFKFPVENFYLFESKLSPKGAVHIKLQEFPLRKFPPREFRV